MEGKKEEKEKKSNFEKHRVKLVLKKEKILVLDKNVSKYLCTLYLLILGRAKNM